MTNSAHEFPVSTRLSDLKERIIKTQRQNAKIIQTALHWIDITVADNNELRDWFNTRISKQATAGYKLEEVIRGGYPAVTIFSHNPGNNEHIGFSLLKGVDGKFKAFITINKFWHQGKHNSSLHWKKIVFDQNSRAEVSTGLSTFPDSSWILEMSRAMQNRKETEELLFALMEAEIKRIKKEGDLC